MRLRLAVCATSVADRRARICGCIHGANLCRSDDRHIVRDWRISLLGLPLGIGITFLNAWLSDKFVDPWIAKYQRRLQKRIPRIVINIAAFAWAVALSAIAMLAPLAILGSAVLTRIRLPA